jgi:hypothetical protein
MIWVLYSSAAADVSMPTAARGHGTQLFIWVHF